MSSFKRYDTGAATLLPDKIDAFIRTGNLGPMLIPPHLRDMQRMTIFDPINNICTEEFIVDGWEELRPGSGSHICVPKGIRSQPLRPVIHTPPHIWSYLNKQITGSPVESCTPVNYCVHAYSWRDMEHMISNPDSERRILNHAVDYIKWEHDDPDHRKDRELIQNLHLMTADQLADYVSGRKTFCITRPW